MIKCFTVWRAMVHHRHHHAVHRRVRRAVVLTPAVMVPTIVCVVTAGLFLPYPRTSSDFTGEVGCLEGASWYPAGGTTGQIGTAADTPSVSVPEPSTILLLGWALVIGFFQIRRTR